MAKIVVHQESCKGCQFCIAICPKKALYVSDYMNAKGYHATAVDEEKCIACGTCFVVCPDYVFEILEGN